MTSPDSVAIHALTGDIEVLSSTSPNAAAAPTPSAQELTRPIRRISRPVAAWLAIALPVRARWRGAPAGLLPALLVLAAALGILALRLTDIDTEAGPAPRSEPAVEQADTTARSDPEHSVVPVGIPATEDPTGPSPVQLTTGQLAALPQASVVDSVPGAPADPAPTTELDGQVLHPIETTVVYTAPGGPAIVSLPARLLGADTWVPIVDRQPGWAMVLLPTVVPDGAPSPAGWIHLTRSIALDRIDRHIRIDSRNGSISVIGPLGAAGHGITGAVPRIEGGRRTFVALAPASRPTYWPASVWWPVLVRTDRLCPHVLGGMVIPGLRWDSSTDRLDAAGCLPIPPATQPLLRDLPAGTAVFLN